MTKIEMQEHTMDEKQNTFCFETSIEDLVAAGITVRNLKPNASLRVVFGAQFDRESWEAKTVIFLEQRTLRNAQSRAPEGSVRTTTGRWHSSDHKEGVQVVRELLKRLSAANPAYDDPCFCFSSLLDGVGSWQSYRDG